MMQFNEKLAALVHGALEKIAAGAGPGTTVFNPPTNIGNKMQGAPGAGAGMPNGMPTGGNVRPYVHQPSGFTIIPKGRVQASGGAGAGGGIPLPPKPTQYDERPGHKPIKPWGWK